MRVVVADNGSSPAGTEPWLETNADRAAAKITMPMIPKTTTYALIFII